MRRRLRSFAIPLLLSIPAAAHSYCPGWDKTQPGYDPSYYSVSHEFRRARYVVEAVSLREAWLGEDGKPKPLRPPFQFGYPKPWGFDPYMGAYYDVGVRRSFKGKVPTHLRLFSENSTARFWLKKGVKYVLFVTKEQFDPRSRTTIGSALTVDTCGNSTDLQSGRTVIRQLRKLAKRESAHRPKI